MLTKCGRLVTYLQRNRHCNLVAFSGYSHSVRNLSVKHPQRFIASFYQKLNSDTIYKNVSLRRPFHTSLQLCDEVKSVLAPQFAESISEGDIRWEKAVGDTVAEDELVAEVETDKTTVPINSPHAGVIEELLVEDGTAIKSGQAIFKIRVGAVGAAKKESSESSTQPEPQQSPSPSPVPPSPASSQPSSPPPAPPKPTAPSSSTPVFSFTPPTPVTEVPGVLGPNRSEHRVKINRMRQRIAQRLKDAQNTYAMLTTFNEIDMSNAIELRNSYKDAFLKKHNLKLGFMSAFVKATAYALLDQPIVNAVIDDQDIVYRDYIDISVAVATPKGLVVPVLRNVENMNYAQIEQAIADMGEKARTNNLAIEDMDGGTFTISNGGVFGSLFGTPIINPPQSAILGMHGIVERPVAVKGKVEIRPMMYVALTYDHRIIDGREAVTFLRKIKSTVEDPRLMLLDL